jgi:hypothetical protein
MFRWERMHLSHARSRATERLLPVQSLAGSTIDTDESSFRKRQAVTALWEAVKTQREVHLDHSGGGGTARRTGSGRSRAARSSPLTFRRFGHAINTDQVFGTHRRRCACGLAACPQLRAVRTGEFHGIFYDRSAFPPVSPTPNVRVCAFSALGTRRIGDDPCNGILSVMDTSDLAPSPGLAGAEGRSSRLLQALLHRKPKTISLGAFQS